MDIRHDILTVSFYSSIKGESGLCVARNIGDEISVLKMELGEQADILYHLLTEQTTKATIKEELKMKTYSDIYNEFCNKFPNAEVLDYRPAVEMHIPQLSRAIPNAIVVWLKDGSEVIYISGSEE